MNRLLVLALACGTALSSIQILHPKDLKVSVKNEGFVKASLGNFGHVIYGTSVVCLIFKLPCLLARESILPSEEHRRLQRLF